ncbi:DMA protein, partial [Alcedo cyanopectus]|nr:DMA protein [Ceyx cyanopectus]
GGEGLVLALPPRAPALFRFDFGGSRWIPELPELPPWPPGTETPPELLLELRLCRQLLQMLEEGLRGRLPQARGIPVASVSPQFPLESLPPGSPLPLLCRLDNIYPPHLELTWAVDGTPQSSGGTWGPLGTPQKSGGTLGAFSPAPDLSFSLFSYLRVVPAPGKTYSCRLRLPQDNGSVVA